MHSAPSPSHDAHAPSACYHAHARTRTGILNQNSPSPLSSLRTKGHSHPPQTSQLAPPPLLLTLSVSSTPSDLASFTGATFVTARNSLPRVFDPILLFGAATDRRAPARHPIDWTLIRGSRNYSRRSSLPVQLNPACTIYDDRRTRP